ncbi:accessory protein [Meliandou praomys virus]|uniref:Accessory protein n=1 Tax=Meliandou praomys virus TaxID=2940988 RepID=A0AAE9KY37_9MONO|nr:accessory protein [Meliandou praomys virus]
MMEWRLSSLYNRIRRTFRRPTEGVQSRNQLRRRGLQHGNSLERVSIREMLQDPGEWDAVIELRKQMAAMYLEELSQIKSRQKPKQHRKRHQENLNLTRTALLEQVLTSVEETGLLPNLATMSFPKEDLLTEKEWKVLQEIIRQVELMLPTTIRY